MKRLLLVTLIPLLAGCGASDDPTPAPPKTPPPPVAKTPEEVVRAYVAAYDREDANAVLALFHPTSKHLETPRPMYHFFQAYEVTIEIENLAVEKMTETEATVTLDQVTRRVGDEGLPFMDNRTPVTVTLLRHEGTWKILHYQYGDPEELND